MVFPSRLIPSNSLMVRGYEHGREKQEFDPTLANFFRVRICFLSDGKEVKNKQLIIF